MTRRFLLPTRSDMTSNALKEAALNDKPERTRAKNAMRQVTCKAMLSVKFVQTNDGQISAFGSTFKHCNAAL